MDKLLQDLGGIVLNALPTSILVLILAIFVRKLYLTPLEAVLAERYKLTEGARKAAESALQAVDSKVSGYEAALSKARTEIYAEQAAVLADLNNEMAARIADARRASDTTLAAVRRSVALEGDDARAQLASTAAALASELADGILGRRAA